MPNYRRPRVSGGTWFFTVVAYQRQPVLTAAPVRGALSNAIARVKDRFPFHIDAWVLLPDHLHCIWTLPADDQGFSYRWSLIKRITVQQMAGFRPDNHSKRRRKERCLWQRRFWEHAVRNEPDYRHHLEYCYWNPVKHGLVSRVRDWPYSTFHRDVRRKLFSRDWGGEVEYRESGGKGEP